MTWPRSGPVGSDIVMFHTRMSALGCVAGGPRAVIGALHDAVAGAGNLDGGLRLERHAALWLLRLATSLARRPVRRAPRVPEPGEPDDSKGRFVLCGWLGKTERRQRRHRTPGRPQGLGWERSSVLRTQNSAAGPPLCGPSPDGELRRQAEVPAIRAQCAGSPSGWGRVAARWRRGGCGWPTPASRWTCYAPATRPRSAFLGRPVEVGTAGGVGEEGAGGPGGQGGPVRRGLAGAGRPASTVVARL